jgi:TFIIB zinc-binding
MEKLVKCSSCNGDKIVTDYESGEIICGKCGLVIYDLTQEYVPHLPLLLILPKNISIAWLN